ncbi:uncharacterized protein LOC8270294 isoform X2 [Ricinus communis]|uniref:uncharacterized protein LOC8270294 isoform X2 n=1 Tax=Ricinus communis TaxID=3988 RepID=UPI00201B1863|nr:uncharacterized protein LOC8270294 isoform X2 [Ricinus communis]
MAQQKMQRRTHTHNQENLKGRQSYSSSKPIEQNLHICSEIFEESSLDWRTLDQRCANLTFLAPESDGHWRVAALPIRCFNQENKLGSGDLVNMDSLHLVSPPSINAFGADQTKAPKGFQSDFPRSVKSRTTRSLPGSNVRYQSQKKTISNKLIKSNDFSCCTSCQSTVARHNSYCLIPGGCNAINSSGVFIDSSRVNQAIKKSSRKKTRRKGKNNKKISSYTRTPEPEVLFDHAHGSSTYETCSYNDHGDELLSYGISQELSFPDGNSNKFEDGSGVCFSEASGVNSSKECFSNINLLDGIIDLFDKAKGTKHHIQSFGGSNVQFLVPGKGDEQIKTLPRSSTVYKFGNSRIGKENIHSVWQKVQRDDRDDCNCELKKVPTCSQVNVALEGAPLLKNNCNVALVNTLSGPEDKRQPKTKVLKKLQKEGGLGSKQGYNCNNGRGCNSIKARLNGHAMANIKQNEILGTSAEVNNEERVKCLPKHHNQSSGSQDGFYNNKVERVNSGSANMAQVFSDELELLESTSNSVSGDINHHTSEVQPPVYLPHLVGIKVSQINKEISLEYSRKNHSSVSTLQKWIPIGVKVPGLTKLGSSLGCFDEPLQYWILRDTVEKKSTPNFQDHFSSLTTKMCKEGNASCLSREDNFIPKPRNPNPMLKHNGNHVTADCLTSEFQDHNCSVSEVESSKILHAVNDACRIQLKSEAVQMVIGGPIAELERFLHFSSPVICQLPSFLCCPCLRDQLVHVALCRDEIPNISLGCVWQWYEKHGSYGLEIKAEDYRNSRRLGLDHGTFCAYFVPYLSAVQLWKRHEPIMRNNNEDHAHRFSERCEISIASEKCSNGLPQMVLQPCKRESSKSAEVTPSDDIELLFEYFESDQPRRRLPLYEKIHALVRGDGPKQGKIYGDPTNLSSLNLHDLHPVSWYSVAWYPIYRIPDGNFRAAFLTYHSFSHLVSRCSKFDSPSMNACVVSPVVGLQSYNSQAHSKIVLIFGF